MTFRLFVAALVATLVTLFTHAASAQAITIVNEQSLPRLDKDGNQIAKRPLQLTPEAVNLQDCIDDQKIRFTLNMSGFVANAIVQAWASNGGADCKSQQQRQSGVAQCWRLLDSDIPLIATGNNVDIPVRRIMAGAPANPMNPDSSEAICGKVNLSTVTVHFLYFAPGNQAEAASDKTVGITIDTVGPDPPSGLQALPGDTRIQVRWVNISGGDPDSGATGGLTELTGVKVYCDVAGSGAATDGGAAEPDCEMVEVDAGLDDAGNPRTQMVEVCDAGTSEPPPQTGDGECTSENFAPSDGSKVFPTAEFNAKFECGSIAGNSGTSIIATQVAGKPLVNGTTYAVAVANTDKFGNVGQLSQPICMTPEVTTDFWDDYRKAGGKAGGGCATNGATASGLGAGALGVALAALGASRWRRRHRRAKAASEARSEEAKGTDIR